MHPILFWSRGEEAYRFLSNFHLAPFTLDGKVWPSVEHYYQAQKYAAPEIQERVRLLPTPGAAKSYRCTLPLRADWATFKLEVMKRATWEKFKQNPQLATLLLATGVAELVHYAPWGDTYWGVDKNGKGQNIQGKYLMSLRACLSRRQQGKEK